MSAPKRGINALSKMTKYIDELERNPSALPEHPVLGKTTMAPTMISATPHPNMIPDKCILTIDCRNIPAYGEDQWLHFSMEFLKI